jgi:cyclic pyranopterin phosphate synthase
MVGVCIQRMDLAVPLGQFVMSRLCREVQGFRDDEYARLASLDLQQVVGLARLDVGDQGA